MKKKSRIFIYPLIIMGLVLILAYSCKKKEEVPVVITSAVSEITKTTATCGGSITSDGGASVTARGVCWSTAADPTTADSKTTDGTGTISFTSAISGLTAGTTYNVRAYATNSAGTAYGTAKSFTTLPLEVPVVTTTAITNITGTSASTGGNVTSDGGTSVTARGVCWSTTENPTIDDSKTTDGDGTGEFSSNITDLELETTYYVRAYATNSVGTAYGTAVSFLTSGTPVLTTSAISELAMTSITCGGNIASDGGSAITARGVCWSTAENPTISDSKTTDGTGTGEFTSYINGLTGTTTYYVRAYATNSSETGYGNQVSFTTLGENQIADYDGNIYNTITINDQVWTVENLRVKHYRNGEEIIWGYDDWLAVMEGPACTQYSEESWADYGAMYNWYAVMDSRNIAPQGWHVPTLADIQKLATFLGGEDAAYNKLKEAGNDHWTGTNNGTNESGWTALPGGYVENHGWSAEMGTMARYWLSSVSGTGTMDYFQLTTYLGYRTLDTDKQTHAFLVRIVKD